MMSRRPVWDWMSRGALALSKRLDGPGYPWTARVLDWIAGRLRGLGL